MRSNLYKYVAILLSCFLFACSKKNEPNPSLVHKVLILGNSITYAPANPADGWNCNCGMAASAVENDYVHLLEARFKALNKSSTVDGVNIGEFESKFDTYDFTKLQIYRDAKPDIIILRIGEVVTRKAEIDLFESKYIELLNYLRVNNPGVKILAAGSVLPNRDLVNSVMSKNSDYISLNWLQIDRSNFAFGLFANPGIEKHPSDQGMRAISAKIWDEMLKRKFL
ncbi:MAG: SGNH/GDSL hydrolase family protein [Sphingobacteriaceae bacterium]|nr:MAG: SGNH/GDSL hydrolase family protein [Sphingobacteriaceae bacterium]